MDISVIVPVYNVEKYLEDCVNSLLNQGLEKDTYEIILVDDGSTDKSSSICDDYAVNYENIRVIHQQNHGLGNARNVGIDAAKGEYICFIDSDDLLEKDSLNYLYSEVKKHDLDEILFSAKCFASDNYNGAYNEDAYKHVICVDEIFSGKKLFINMFLGNKYICNVPLRLYKTSLINNLKLRFPEKIIHEDQLFGFYSLFYAEKVKCINKEFYLRRYRPGSIMTSSKAFLSCEGYFYTFKELMKDSKLLNKNNDSFYVINKFVNFFFDSIINLYSEKLDKKERKQFKEMFINIKEIAKQKILKYNLKEKIFLFSPVLFRFIFICRANLLNHKN